MAKVPTKTLSMLVEVELIGKHSILGLFLEANPDSQVDFLIDCSSNWV